MISGGQEAHITTVVTIRTTISTEKSKRFFGGNNFIDKLCFILLIMGIKLWLAIWGDVRTLLLFQGFSVTNMKV
jgi:hypothetical protein